MIDSVKSRVTRSLVLSPDFAELSRARRFVAEVAADAGFGEARSFDITLLASEAAANAIEHAPVKGGVEIKALLYPDRLEIQVKGPGEFQTPDRLNEQRTRGLGLPLMAKLSDHLALYSAPEGGTLLSLTFYREGHRRARAESPLPPSLLELFETSDRLEAVFEAMPEGFAIFDDDLRCVYLNDAMADHDGRPRAKLLGSLMSLPESGEPLLLSIFEAANAEGAEVSRELRHPQVDMWSEVSVIPFAGGYALFSRDITDRRKNEEIIRQRSLLLDLSSEAIFAWELDGPIRYWNSGAERLYGYRAEEAIGRGSRELLGTVFPRSLAHLESALRQHAVWRGELLHTGRSGRSITVEARLQLIDAGGVQLVLETNRDITERKHAEQAEEVLRESEERYRVLAEENERLYRQQLDIAEKLQFALLNIPSEIGRVRVGHLYRSATEAARVGGDFYDVYEVKGGLVCMLVGDVAGHGIEAARTATLVKDVVHAFTHQSVRPQEVLRRTNALLVEKELPGFVTLFLGVLDSDTGELRYASAGHPNPFLRRANGEIQILGSGSAPLGIHSEATWKPGREELAAGDLLLLYTDGVTEVRRDGEFFGEKRLQSLLKRKRISVERLPHLVLDQVLAFSGGDLKDDVAVLALSLIGESGAAKPKPAFEQERLLK